MHRIGLALSGGGFRATLFHLGMLRFLREANILPDVTQITSVSGGSILAAHLVLHWDRYNASLEEFDAAAAEVIRFVQLDIRNRVVRRYPLAMPLRALNRLAFRGPHRQLTRTGLLEYHYEQFLYGDTCLFQLPERPRLHILATNLSEGCLCAFTRDGLLMQRRRKGEPFRFERIHTSLATVPMAVTASSAFPGFFPPIELQGEDVGADPGQFGRLAFTDGGVYDNLGVRMFRCMERSWMAREVRLEPDDVTDAGELIRVLRAALESSEDTPLRRLAQMLALPRGGTSSAVASSLDSVDRLLDSLWDVMSYENLAREPAFAHLSPPDPEVGPLIETARTNGSEIEAGEQLWLNRQLIDAAFRQGAGIPCFHSLSPCFDTVLVSDAGRQFKINNARAGGLVATGMRATDIVMNRVWELETDTFSDAPGFVFAPISRVIEQDDDPTALHPEVQRMTADIRTDLDRFSPLEISSLIRHGYCVGRSACKSRPDLFGAALPDSAPWDPLAAGEMPARSAVATELKADVPAVAPETEQTRKLQQSARRRLWSTLLDYRDWTSYLYVPLLVPILVILPYFLVKWYRESQVAQHLIEGIAQSNQDYALIRNLLQDGPPLTEFAGMPIAEVGELPPPQGEGIEVISDTRIGDLRGLQYESEPVPEKRSWLFVYRRMRIRKLEPTANRFSIHFRLPTTKLEVRTTNSRVPAVAQLNRGSANGDGQQQPVLEVAFDLSKVPVDEVVDLPIELMSNEPAHSVVQAATFYVDFDTGMLSYWLLLPEGKRYQNFEMLRYPSADPGLTAPELVAPANMLNTLDGRILAFALLKLEPGFMYECRWEHRD